MVVYIDGCRGQMDREDDRVVYYLAAGLRVRVGSEDVRAADCVRNLGIYFDKHLEMTKQVSRIIGAYSQQSHDSDLIRRFLHEHRRVAETPNCNSS